MKINIGILSLLIAGMFLLGCIPGEPGTLSGTVSVGPLTPVERAGVPTPTPAPEVFTSRGLDIYKANGQTLFKQIRFSGSGTFSVELPPSTYVITLTPSGIDSAAGLPVTVTIEAGKITTLTIQIDTGIR